MSSRIRKITFSVVAILIFAVLVLPLVIGVWIKYEYNALLGFYNSQEGIHIEVKNMSATGLALKPN
jgi:hypothetical protein